MSTKILTIIRGTPGSGKSTLASALSLSTGASFYETDQFFYDEDGDYIYNKALIKDAHEWCFRHVKHTMMQGKDVIVSNTFTQLWQYEKYLDLAKEFGYTIQMIVVASPLKSVHGVPDNVVQRMQGELELDLMENPLTSLIT